ncbi:MAG TPA: DnaJ C-terminal domain-containing protein [Steroidobacteraceae bacterium]|jgi:curved DNA-binding protein|nr:DnaJ C-terminal domain-containing protein [Steroidobacteraceae bacterium]
MQFKDYYEALGVSRGAAAEEVKRAYRKQARKYHPDVSKEKNAEEKFKNVQEAYEVLKDPDKRAAYDQLGRNYRSGQQFRPPPDWEQRFGQSGGHRFSDLNGFSDFFSSLFGAAGGGAAGAGTAGGGGAGGFAQREADGGQVEVSVEEAYAGTRRRVTINENGRARLVDVQIPAGVADGQALRVGGVGRSALILRVKLRPHPIFVLQGKDVQVELPLAPWEAALGAKIAVPTLGGTVELTIPAGAQAGQKLRLRGRGFPGVPNGDQFVVVKLVTPAAETPQAKEAYERMRREFNFNPRAAWP